MHIRPGQRQAIRRGAVALFLLLALPGAAFFLLKAVPSLSGCLVKAGLISAGINLPEGGLAVLGRDRAESSLKEENTPSEEEASSRAEVHAPASPVSEAQPEASLPPESSSLVLEEPEILEANKGVLLHKTYTAAASSIYIPLENGYIKNCTALSQEEILKQIEHPPYFSIEETDEPQVLIMHTHTTESYLPFSGDVYDVTYPTRTTDNAQNMVAVGNEIQKELEAAGIGVIHDMTQHDYPSYNGSYERSKKTVEKYLEAYPSIKVVLDIHRDAIVSGTTVTAPVAEVEGKTAAQVMIISGCDDGTMNYPDYLKNLSFSAALQNRMEGDFPGLTRPVLFDYRFYNQSLTTGSILIEVGSHGNTLEQALWAGSCVGRSLGALLNSLKG